MKRQLSLLLLLPGVLATVPQRLAAQPAETKPEETKRVGGAQLDPVTVAVTTLIENKDYSGAARSALAGVREGNRAVNDRLRLLKLAVDATRKLPKPLADMALIPYRETAADATVPNSVKVEILAALSEFVLAQQAGKDLRDMDTRPAWEILASGLDLPNLSPAERATVLKNIGAWWETQRDWPKAREAYLQAVALPIPPAAKAPAQRAIVQSWVNEGNSEQALKAGQEFKLDPLNLYSLMKDRAAFMAEARAVLGDNSRPEAQRWAAFSSLPQLGWADANNPALTREALELGRRYFPAFQAADPKRANVLLAKFKKIDLPSSRIGSADPAPSEYLAWSAPYLVQSPKISAADYDLVRFGAGNALAALGRKLDLLAEAKSTAADATVLPRTRLWAALVEATVGREPRANPAALVKPILNKPASGEDKVWATREAARTAGRINDEAAARTLLAAGDALLSEPPPARIPCRYLEVAPANVTAWKTSPLLKEARNRGALDRPYGDNLQFLIETDSAVLGRTAATGEGDTGDKATDLFTACDENGIYLFINAHDVRYREVMEGFASGGGLEMYLAPGPQQSYYAMLAGFPGGNARADSFMTNYPGEQFRWPVPEDGTYFSVCEPTGDGFGLVMFFAWELFADKLPAEGTRWQFEAIRWTRAGGFTFGGSKSVHNRSSFGEIEFEGLDARALTAIKRRIVTRAVTMYRNALRINGPVGNWDDAEVGDPGFYQAVVLPETKRLDPYAARVTARMNDADVNEIYREAVPAWMNLERRMAAARAQYLLKKRVP